MSVIRHRHQTAARSRLMLSFTAMALVFSFLGAIDWGGALAQLDQDIDGTTDAELIQDTQDQEVQQGLATEVPNQQPQASEVPTEQSLATEVSTDQPQVTEEPGVDPTAETIVDPPVESIEDPTAMEEGPVEDSELTPLAPPSRNSLNLTKLDCPAGTDRDGGSPDFAAVCSVQEGVTFTAGIGDRSWPGTTDAAGAVQWDDLPSGTWWVQESMPAGYEDPVVICGSSSGSGGYARLSAAGGYFIGKFLGNREFVGCAVYNIQAGDDESATAGEVRLWKYFCPPGTERAEDWTALSEQCTETAMPVTFTVNAGEYFSRQVTEGNPGSTVFSEIPFGTIEIAEDVPFGYGDPLYFCGNSLTTGPGGYVPVPTGDDAKSIAWVYEDHSGTVGCLVFNFHEEIDTSSNLLSLTKYDCPADADRESGLPTLGTTCERMPGVDFTLLTGKASDTQTTDGSGQIEWPDIPTMPWDVQETIPAGYGDPVVFCGPDGHTETPRVPAPGGLFHGEFTSDHTSCTVFNFQDEDPTGNLLRIAKWDCPSNIDRESGLPTFGTTCERMPGVEFTLEFDGGELFSTTDASGEIAFEAIPAGAWSVQETIAAGYGDPVVFCGPMFETETPRVDATGGRFTGEFSGTDETTVCSVFNIQEESDNTVTVNKYVCSPDANPEEVILLDVCAPGGDGIKFEFVDGLGRHYGTVSGGVVEWTGVYVGIGELQIVETIPDGYGLPFVICDGLRMDTNKGFVALLDPGLDNPFHITCDWFNFIAEDSSLTVIKHDCPPGYDLKAADSQPFEDCLELVDGVDFNLGGPATDLTSTTGDASTGTVRFGDIDAGEYILTETVPEGTEFSFVADCYGNAVGRVHPYPLATGDTLDLTISAGEQVICYWFNVPEQEGGQLTVIKYICASKEFVSDVDCEIYEDGQGFDLLDWNGSAYVSFETGITDGAGRLTWTELDEGSYLLDEHDREWCHLEPSIVSEDDLNGFMVLAGQEQVIKVYNCDGVPGKPGKTPTKYPDTGVPMREDWRMVA